VAAGAIPVGTAGKCHRLKGEIKTWIILDFWDKGFSLR
jgi:hypothetical protein